MTTSTRERSIKELGEEVGYNTLILENIFKYMSPMALLKARSVNKLWFREATRIFRRETLLKVKLLAIKDTDWPSLVSAMDMMSFPALDHEWDVDAIITTCSDPITWNKVKLLSERIGRYASGIIFKSNIRHDLATEDPFFRLCDIMADACGMTELSLDISSAQRTWLCSGLEIDGSGRIKALICSPQNTQCLRLEHLQKLNVGGGMSALPSLLHGVLHASPNLETINGFTYEMTDVVIESGKIHCIKSLIINSPGLERRIRQFSSHSPSLKSLEIVSEAIEASEDDMQQEEEIGQVIGELIRANKKSLRYIKGPNIGYLKGGEMFAPILIKN